MTSLNDDKNDETRDDTDVQDVGVEQTGTLRGILAHSLCCASASLANAISKLVPLVLDMYKYHSDL